MMQPPNRCRPIALFAGACGLLALVASEGLAIGQDSGARRGAFAAGRAAESPDPVIIRAGVRKVSAHQLQAWLNRSAASLLQTTSTRSQFLQSAVLVDYPRLLRRTLAAEQTLQSDPALRTKVDALLVQALRYRLLDSTQVDPKEVAALYKQQQGEFLRPEALHLWRIQFAARQGAQQFLKKLGQTTHPQRLWSRVAATQSVDTATHLRNGDLGFVRQTGHTDVPQVRVNKALYEAAQAVPDGDYITQPVAEGDRWAVIWRRGSRPDSAIPLSEVADQLELYLRQERVRDQIERLQRSLLERAVSGYRPELIESIKYPKNRGLVPTQTKRHQRPADRGPTPHTADRGDR